jgi:enoyl-CoA hydratase
MRIPEAEAMAHYETILVETRGRVGLLTLHRPQALNALNLQVATDVIAALRAFDADEGVGSIVVTGSEKAFAAGADIKEMVDLDAMSAYLSDAYGQWEELARIRKPVIAAVSGFALGGGCELAMMCDLIIASDTAKFGQPEIKLGIIPGMGGTQRLVRAIGKAKAMEMCLTGRMMDAQEAEQAGLVARIVPAAELLDKALELAATIASMSTPMTMMAKEAVNRAYEMTLAEGLRFERRLFHSAFASADQSEGMAAFVEKRKPEFRNR